MSNTAIGITRQHFSRRNVGDDLCRMSEQGKQLSTFI